MAILEIEDLVVEYAVHGSNPTRAVDGVNLRIEDGQTVGLVGESGCGKSSLAYSVLGLIRHTAGAIRFRGEDIATLRGRTLLNYRRLVQIVFQDPFNALNPRMSIGACLNEVLRVHALCATKGERQVEVDRLLRSVELDPRLASNYPHELSGGQRQRVGIARALAVQPSLLIADEPVSALDVSVQVQILNLLKDLKTTFGLSYLFIAHDLAVVRYMCDTIYVMHNGRIVESAPAGQLIDDPKNAYTKTLLSAVPDVTQASGGQR
jgi:peptide/nickel transport system ATP-binding protein